MHFFNSFNLIVLNILQLFKAQKNMKKKNSTVFENLKANAYRVNNFRVYDFFL